MFSEFFNSLSPSKKTLSLILIVFLFVGTYLVTMAASNLIGKFCDDYTILFVGIVMLSIGIIISIMRPHLITVSVTGLGIVFILLGAFIGG